MRNISILIIILTLSACAATSETANSIGLKSNADETRSTSVAEQTSENDAATSESAADDSTRLVCKSETVTGSNRKARVCRKVSN